MREHLDTDAALRAIAEGRKVPKQKHAALRSLNLIRVRGHGAGSRTELTDAGRARLASPPPAASREVLMPHAKEHPLARYVAVPIAGEDGADTGEGVYVVDWLDRLPEVAWVLRSDTRAAMAYRARTRGQGLDDSGVVLARDQDGLALIHHAELPAYGALPAGGAR